MKKQILFLIIDTIIVIIAMMSFGTDGYSVTHANVSAVEVIATALVVTSILNSFLNYLASRIAEQESVCRWTGMNASREWRNNSLRRLELTGYINRVAEAWFLAFLAILVSPMIDLLIYMEKMPPRGSIEATEASIFVVNCLTMAGIYFILVFIRIYNVTKKGK